MKNALQIKSQQCLCRAKLGREHNTLHRFVAIIVMCCAVIQIYVELFLQQLNDGIIQEGSPPAPICKERRRTRRPLLSIRLQALRALCCLLSFDFNFKTSNNTYFDWGPTTGICCCRSACKLSELYAAS